VGNAWITAERADPGSATGFSGESNKSVGAEGAFEMKGLKAGTYQLRIWAGGYAQITTPTFALAEGESRDMGRITVPRGADISGRVTDDAGQPVENATIALKDMAGKPLFSFSLYTSGSDGRYTVQGVVPGRYVVSADARGHAPAQQEAAVGTDGASVDLVLPRGGAIKVRVVDDTGRAVEDASIILLDARGERVTRTLSLVNWFEGGRNRTKADGEATIPDLAAGTYRVRAEKSGVSVVGEEPSVPVTPGATATATVTLAAPK
jgi:protocatechuate 3,4-dioxygenase beta subunit